MAQILHIVNSQALDGGIGIVLNYLHTNINATPEYASTVMKTYSNEVGKCGYEKVEREGQFDNFIYSQNFLAQELSHYDVIHVHGLPSYRILEAIRALQEQGRCPKIVNTCHSSVKKELAAHLEKAESPDHEDLEAMVNHGLQWYPGKFGDTYWGSAIYRQERIMTYADRVQHMTSAYLDEIIQEYRAEENKPKHYVIHNGIKLLSETEITARPKKKRIVYSGRFAVEKGIDEFIEALPLVLAEHPTAEIRLVGGDKTGSLVEAYTRKTADIFQHQFGKKAPNYLKRVSFTGWLSDREKIEEQYDWCDYLVMPSKDESFCLAIAEALNHQRLPIMTATPSLRELYLDEGVGIGIEPAARTPLGIARAINMALETMNEEWQETMARRGRGLVKEKYSLEKIIQQQMKMYEEVLGTAARAPP